MHELTVDSLGFGGDAVGRLDGKVVFVAGGAPGDRLRVRILRERKGFINAQLCAIDSPGPGRREPPCELAARCGGCPWQHVTAATQLEAKRSIVAHALRDHVDEQAISMRAAPQELGYRRRARLVVRGDVIGYRAAGSRELVDAHSCPALCPALQSALGSLRAALRGRGVQGSLSLLSGRAAGHDGDVAQVSLRVDKGGTPPAEALCEGVIVGAVVQHHKSGSRHGVGVDKLDIGEPGAPLWCSAEAFSQANAAQDATLRALVGELVAAAGQGQRPSVLELHAGIGNLTRAAANAAERVLAVERNGAACALLEQNCAGLAVEVRCAEAAHVCWDLTRQADARPADIVLLDPPRQGCAELIEPLAKLAPRHIVYVSCDPMTLARDLGRLQQCSPETTRYVVERAVAIDMMPQTFHIETVVALQRSNA